MDMVSFINAISENSYSELEHCIGTKYEELKELFLIVKGLDSDDGFEEVMHGSLEDNSLIVPLRFKDWFTLKETYQRLSSENTKITFLLSPSDNGYFLTCKI